MTTGEPTTAPLSADARALEAAWLAEFSAPINADDYRARLLRDGCTPADVRRAGLIVRHARLMGGYVPDPEYGYAPDDIAAGDIIDITLRLVRDGCPRDLAYEWAAVHVCVVDKAGIDTRPLWTSNPDRSAPINRDERAPISGWVDRLGALGPWAFAAGLTFDEACARHAVGTLEIEGLRLLAGLRGYLPLAADAGARQ